MTLAQQEISLLMELAKVGGPMVVAIVVLVLAIITVVKFAFIPLAREVRPLTDNLRVVSENNSEAATASKAAAESWIKFAKASGHAPKNLTDT